MSFCQLVRRFYLDLVLYFINRSAVFLALRWQTEVENERDVPALELKLGHGTLEVVLNIGHWTHDYRSE